MTVYVILVCINILIAFIVVSMIFNGGYLLFVLRLMKNSGVVIKKQQVLPKVLCLFLDYLIKYPGELDKTHLSWEDKMVFHFIWSVVIPLLCVIGSLREIALIKTFIIIFIGSLVIKRVLLISFKKQRAMIFNKNAYILYKFLHNQLSAGVQPKECMASLHRIIQEPFLNKRLKALGSMYAQTLDFESAFKEVSSYYEGSDVDAFKIAIQQGLEMGDNLNTIKKQEALMFSKYMNYLQLETNRQKTKTLIIVSIFCAIIIFMVGLPLLMELDQAIQLIFI